LYVQRNNQPLSRSHFRRGKAETITYSEHVSVALVIQHARRMRFIILSSVACQIYHIIPRYLIKGTNSEKKIIEHKVYVLIFSTNLSETFYISLTVHLGIILVNNQLGALFSMYLLISLLYVFRSTQCSSSGESIVSIRHLVCITVCR
jgi:hypothetical protein